MNIQWTLIELAIVIENEARKGNVSTQKRKMKILKSNGAEKEPADLHPPHAIAGWSRVDFNLTS